MFKKLYISQHKVLSTLIALLLWTASSPSHSLPKEVRADQYLLEAQEAYRNGKHEQAVEAFSRIETLNVSMPAEFHFFYGSSLAETDDYQDALNQLSLYLELEGRGGRHYQEALRTYGKMEQEAEKAKFEKDRELATAKIRTLQTKIMDAIDRSDFRNRGEKFSSGQDWTFYEANASASAENLCVIEFSSRIRDRNGYDSSSPLQQCYSARKTIDFRRAVDRDIDGGSVGYEHISCHELDAQNSWIMYIYEEKNESDGIAVGFENYDSMQPLMDPIRTFQKLCSDLPEKWFKN